MALVVCGGASLLLLSGASTHPQVPQPNAMATREWHGLCHGSTLFS